MTEPLTPDKTGTSKKKGKLTTNQKAGVAAGGVAIIVALYLKSRSSSSSSSTTPSTSTPTATTTALNPPENYQSGDIGNIEAQIAALEGEFSSLSSGTGTTPSPGTISVPPLETEPPSPGTASVPAAGGGTTEVPSNSAAALAYANNPSAPIFQAGIDPNSAFATDAGVQGTSGAGDTFAQSSPTDAFSSGLTAALQAASPGESPEQVIAAYEATNGGPPS